MGNRPGLSLERLGRRSEEGAHRCDDRFVVMGRRATGRPCRMPPPQPTERRLGIQAVGHHEFEDEHVE